jgi:hypothetical protein
LNYLANGSARVCLLGDLNLPDFNLDIFIQIMSCFSDFVSNHGLSQHVDQPTRGANILDFVLCSDVICCDNFYYLAPLANSDHCIVSINLPVSLTVTNDADEQLGSSRQHFRRANWQDF